MDQQQNGGNSGKQQLKTEQQKLSNEYQREKYNVKNIEQTLRNLWDNKKRYNICVSVVTEKDKKEGNAEKVCEEIIAAIAPNVVKDINLHIQEDGWIPNGINPKKSMPNHHS